MPQASKDGLPLLSVDIGGTKIIVAIFSTEGRMLDSEQMPTQAEEGMAAVVDRVEAAVRGLLERNSLDISRVSAVSIASAGVIDMGRGMITVSPNLPGWLDIPLAEMLWERLGTDTFLVNDASAAALGEYCFGAGRGAKDIVMLTLGTGIGGGIIIDGELYLGASGGAAEIGHMVVEAGGPQCPCGNRGCLEVLASGTAIARDARNRLRVGESSALLKMSGGDIDSVTADMVADAARQGDAMAQEIFLRAGTYLGIGLANIANIFNPELIIIGGGLANEGSLILDPATKVMTQRAFWLSASTVRVVTAELGNEAGVYGAAVYGLNCLRRGS